jgi:EmrB/QacA subfamily drug resistance transporter
MTGPAALHDNRTDASIHRLAVIPQRAPDLPRPRPATRPSSSPATIPSPPPVAPSTASASQPARFGWTVIVPVLVVGMFLSGLNSNIVNSALPAMAKQLDASTDDIQWVKTAYYLALGIAVMVSGWLGQRIGLRRLYVISLGLFAVTAVLCGMAWSFDSLLAFRVLQAVPGGIVPVVAITLLMRLTPPTRLGPAIGFFAAGAISAPALSPLFSGFFTEVLDWRLVFYVGLPLALLGIVAALIVLPADILGQHPRFDRAGFLLAAVGLPALTLALAKGQSWHWDSYTILVLLAVAVDALAAFVLVELNSSAPLVNVRIFLQRPFLIALLLMQLLYTGLVALVSYVPAFLLQAQALTPERTGTVMLAPALVWIATVLSSGWIYGRFGARRPAMVGFALVTAGALLLTRLDADLSRPYVILASSILSAGLGIAMVPILAAAVIGLPAELVPTAMVVRTIIQRVTATFGVYLISAMTTAHNAQLAADRAALYTTGAQNDPRVTQMLQHNPGALVGLWQKVTAQISAQGYANAFLVVAAISLAGALFALLRTWDRAPRPVN